MFVNDWNLALMAFVIAPLAVVPLAAFSRQLKKQGRKGQIKMSEIYSLIFETISGHQIVKAFTMEEFELPSSSRPPGATTGSTSSWPGSPRSPRRSWSSSAGWSGAFILYIGAERIAKGHLSAGDFGSFALAIF